MKREAPDLDEYDRKRDFRRTSEPRGNPSGPDGRSGAGLRFVVQKHAARRLHYDLRLELDGTLKSWAVPKGPSLDPDVRALAVRVEDHPLDYASFEGTIPKGEYGGGTVMVWDDGSWAPATSSASGEPGEGGSEDAARRGLERGRLHFTLHGERLRGEWLLVRMKGKEEEDDRNWLLQKKPDAEAAGDADLPVTTVHTTSSASGRTMEEIASDTEDAEATGPTGGARAVPDVPDGARKSNMPRTLEPQLPTLVNRAPRGEDWLHELKFDGYRIMAWIEDGKTRLMTRGGHDWSDRFPTVIEALAALPIDDSILDGEIAVLVQDGTTDFQALQNSMGGGGVEGIRYFVFDLPWFRGHDLRKLPLVERKRVLRELLRVSGTGGPLRYSDHIVGGGARVARQACLHALEGVIAKRSQSRYREGRTQSWVKVKCTDRQEFVVGGWTDPSGSRSGFGALLLGWFDEGGRLRFAGRVGTGFSAASLAAIRERLDEIGTANSPFDEPPTGADARGVHWVEPTLVGEVAFAGWTEAGRLRQPSFKGLRSDRAAMSVKREKPVEEPVRDRPVAGRRAPPRVAGVTLTNSDRVLYPEQGVTKRDLARYFETVAPWMLPHVKGRPLSLVRCPGGREEKCFYQKHLTEGLPAPVRGIEVGGDGESDTYVAVDDVAGLVTLVQFGTLELHPWGSREDRLERPDRIVFDLDPGEGVAWPDVVHAARSLRARLDDLGLEGYLRTSGGKGLHVVIPIARRSSWEDVKGFARDLSRTMERDERDRYVSTASKAKRKGRIYVDYLRNGRGATAVASYSPRARPGAPVATPIRWDEVGTLSAPDRYTVKSLPARLAALGSDPWEGFLENHQVLTRAMKEAAAG